MAARPLAWCPGCWLRARVRSWGCAMAAVEGAPVEREAGGGLEVRLRCVRTAGGPCAWVPPGSGVERSSEAGSGLLFSLCGEGLGSQGRRRVVRGAGPSAPLVLLGSGVPCPRPSPCRVPLLYPVPSCEYRKLSPPDPESTLGCKLTLFHAQRCGRRVCTRPGFYAPGVTDSPVGESRLNYRNELYGSDIF